MRGCVKLEAAGRLEVIWKTNLGWAAEVHCAKEGREGGREARSLLIESLSIAPPPVDFALQLKSCETAKETFC